MYIGYNKLVIITEPKTVCFNLTKKVHSSLKHEIGFIIRFNKDFAEHKTKKRDELIVIQK